MLAKLEIKLWRKIKFTKKENIKCTECDEEFQVKGNLKEHVLLNHKEQIIENTRVFVEAAEQFQEHDGNDETDVETNSDTSSIDVSDKELDEEEENSETESGEEYWFFYNLNFRGECHSSNYHIIMFD